MEENSSWPLHQDWYTVVCELSVHIGSRRVAHCSPNDSNLAVKITIITEDRIGICVQLGHIVRLELSPNWPNYANRTPASWLALSLDV